MTIKIESSITDALTLRLAEGLASVDLMFGLHVTDFKFVEESDFPLPANIAEKLVSVCGEPGFASFLYGEVARDLDGDRSYAEYQTDKLGDVDSYADPIAASRSLINRLKALPYRYHLSVPLPIGFSSEYRHLCDDIELGSGISIMSGSKLLGSFPTRTGVGALDKALENQGGAESEIIPNPNLLYLVQRTSGYIGRDKDSPLLAEFRSILRQFLGIGLAVGLIREQWRSETPTGSYVAHRADGDTEIIAAEKLPQQLLGFYGSLAKAAPPETVEDTKRAGRRLKAVKSAFKSSEHGRRLSVAAMWYLRSKLSKETLDGLLEATIAIEALFGGGSSEGAKVSSILSNRCAYRIAQSVEERETILAQFKEIYDLRSRIVHEGHHRFTAKERALLRHARDICKRSLMLEATLAGEDC